MNKITSRLSSQNITEHIQINEAIWITVTKEVNSKIYPNAISQTKRLEWRYLYLLWVKVFSYSSNKCSFIICLVSYTSFYVR